MIPVTLTFFAHAFGQDYSLPIPMWLFVFGGTAAVLLSFVVTLFAQVTRKSSQVPLLSIDGWWLRPLAFIIRMLLLIILLIMVVGGFLEGQSSSDSTAIVLFWVMFFIGFTYVSALFGNVWRYLNPVLSIVRFAELLSGFDFNNRRTYPQSVGLYPPLVVFVGIISLEVVFRSIATSPTMLSSLLLYYIAVTLCGCWLYGKDAWFRYADVFSVYFGIIAKLSSIEYRKNSIVFNLPFSGLFTTTKLANGLVPFVVFMLAATSFDGLSESELYARGNEYFSFLPTQAYALMILAVLWVGLYMLYHIAIIAGLAAKEQSQSTTVLKQRFILSLLPIVLGYHIAHYFTYFISTLQQLVAAADNSSDLLWSLFDLSGNTTNSLGLSQHAIWYVQISAIIIGHIVSIFVAHKIASNMFTRQRDIVISQLPIVIIMLIYTTLSLLIIASPARVDTPPAVTFDEPVVELDKLRQPPAPTSP